MLCNPKPQFDVVNHYARGETCYCCTKCIDTAEPEDLQAASKERIKIALDNIFEDSDDSDSEESDSDSDSDEDEG